MFKLSINANSAEELKSNLKAMYLSIFKEEMIVDTDHSQVYSYMEKSDGNTEYKNSENEVVDANDLYDHGQNIPSVINESQLDSDNLPWDARIHSSSKQKTSEGKWRIRKGIKDPTLIERVKQEIRVSARPTQNLNLHDLNNITLPNNNIVAAPVNVAPIVEAPKVVEAPKPAMPQFNKGHTLDSFKTNFALIVGNLITEEKIDQNYINQLKQYFQVQEIWQANDTQKEEMFNSFVGYGLIQKVG